ncbi:MAG: PDZ domain-containing protein [Candidatus Cloacimonetes bacterium]|nr:PDZ domain-containing protein [Candidatus Cloacimonadota bacterium]MCF7813198.1 PDZ domain-containing protein [Candidatus Cloacimonadota bacterium]MCF7867646.1 PDZ domain-containing protein [Candidatus Cloacimonadota bacterium]MCF7883079.1 PDZ domain-containing protein [Candidatus Cloacimonadota bacterium]
MKQFIGTITLIVLISIISCENPQIAMFEKFKGGEAVEIKDEIVVPFTLKRSHVIQVPVYLKDKNYRFILDTGGMTMANAELNDSLNFETMETPQQNVKMALTDEIKLGDACVKGMKLALTDFDDTFKLDMPGMIGTDYLRFFNVQIDYQNRQITLRNSYKMKRNNHDEHLMKFEMIPPYFPTVDLEINNEFHIPGMIDTGLHYAFVFPINWMENLPEEEKQNLIDVEGYFVRWPWTESPQNYLYLMPEIILGDIVLKDVPVLFGEIPDFLNNTTALIGKYFLENYLTTIDFPNRQIKFEERQKSNYSLRYSSGIHMAKKAGKLQITGVLYNPPASEANIHPTDELIAINGKKYDEISELEIYNLMMDKTIVKFYVTIIKDNKEKEILLTKQDLFE